MVGVPHGAFRHIFQVGVHQALARPIPDGKLRSVFTNEPSTCKDALYNLFEYLCRMNGYGFEEIDEQAKRGMK